MEVVRNRYFGAADYVVFCFVLVLSAGVGIFFAFTGGRQKSNQEFLMANRQMSVIPVSISMVVTIISAITLVGTPGEMYTFGSAMWWYALSCPLGYIMAAVLFVPLIHPLKLTSAYQYLELRFESKAAKLVGTIITLVNAVLYMGVVLYAPSTAMESVTGAPIWLILLLMFFVSTFYSTLGGLKAVVWVDAIQSLIMLAGCLALVIRGTILVGGMGKVFQICDENGRIDNSDFRPDPTIRHTFWTIVVGGMVDITARTGVYQANVQRYSCVPTVSKARLATLLQIPFLVIIWSLSCMCGLVMFAYYAQQECDPLKAGYIKNPNQLITYWLMDVMTFPGVPGLFVGSVMSAVLSTMSSIQSAAAAITYEDILKPKLSDLTELKQTYVTKGLVILFGSLGMAFAFIMQNMGGTVIQLGLAFVGASVGPLLGMFILGSIFPWANWIGAVVGGVAGLVFPLTISFCSYIYLPPTNYLNTSIAKCPVANITDITTMMATTINPTVDPTISPPRHIPGLFRISYQYYGSIGMATVVVVGLIFSLCKPNKTHDVNPKYLIPLFDWMFCCLPKKVRRWLQCGIDHDAARVPEKTTEEASKSVTEKPPDYYEATLNQSFDPYPEPSYKPQYDSTAL